MTSLRKRGYKAKKRKNHLKVIVSLCSALVLTSGNAHELFYAARGDSVVLDPNFSGQPITSIVWSHESDLVAEWYGDNITCLRQYKGRCSLNKSTGALKITGADESDNGNYSAEINNIKIDSQIQLSVIPKVSKPSILEECNTDLTSCNLTCDGDTTNAGPVSYKWFTGGKEIGSDKKLKITEDTFKDSLSCMSRNPVSNQSSESFKNPIIEGKTNQLIPILVSTFGILALGAVLVLAVFFICRKKNDDSGNPEQGTPGGSILVTGETPV